MLEIQGVHTYYGISHILFDVSLTVNQGEVVCLLGRNGAGKSTTMKSVIGLTPPRRGTVTYRGEKISGLKPYLIARKGIGYVPDDRRVYADLTVAENLEIAERNRDGKGIWNQERVFEVFPGLREIGSRRAGFLSGGEQQMLTIARALMTNPDFLLLDEPTEGLAPLIVKLLEEQILRLKALGMTVLLAEQNQQVALRLADRAYIIDNGVIRYEGTVEELRADEETRKKYLFA
ncbi:MAG TPA: ABC transporter ATP-binding protein [Deferrisomatales bacterium]|nr:ABC transporter ATP-binding protein [Deferrisomatales bacterium]